MPRYTYRQLYWQRRAMEFLYVGLLCFMAQHFSPLTTMLWPSTGIVFGLLFTRGRQVAFGAFIGHLVYFCWQAPAIALPFSLLRITEALALVQATYMWIGPACPLYRRQTLLQFLAFSAVLSLIDSVATTLLIPSLAPTQVFCAHYLGILTFGPALSLLHSYVPEAPLGARLQRQLPLGVSLLSLPFFYHPWALEVALLAGSALLFFWVPYLLQVLVVGVFASWFAFFMGEVPQAPILLIGVVICGLYRIAWVVEGRMDNGIV